MTTVLTRVAARLLFAPALVVGFGTLVKGYADTGDGFAAGVIVALAVLLQCLVFGYREVAARLPLRWAPSAAVAGLAVTLVVAFGPVARGEPVMTHAPAPGAAVVHLGTLELLTAVLFDLGVFLVVVGFAVGALGMIAGVGGRRSP